MAVYKDLVKKVSVVADKKTKQKNYLAVGVLPIIDQGQEMIGGYTDDIDKQVVCDLPVIVFGDHTKAVKYIDFPFGAGADGIKVLQPKEGVLPKYLYYATQYLVLKLEDKGYARHYQYIEKKELSIPLISEQEHIVARIEELFSQLDKGVETLQKTKQQSDAWKVIPCNEYYDTIVDGRLVSPKSIHGQYLNKLSENDKQKLIEAIQSDPRMKRSIRWGNSDRMHGNQIAYQLGSVYARANYLLLAFTRFDKDDRAYLTNELLWQCLLNMWNEIDILHSGKSICFPLMGTGLTRMKNFKLSEQQLLEVLIMSYRLSGLTFGSDVSINIIIHPTHEKHINFSKIKDLSD